MTSQPTGLDLARQLRTTGIEGIADSELARDVLDRLVATVLEQERRIVELERSLVEVIG